MKDQALYLEADEDITSAIDKLAKATGSSVSIVVPKRSALLQSIINLKLLKKAAADNGKELVLVTSDKVASDLAARIGLAVAPSIGATAVMGEATPAPVAATEDVIEAEDPVPEPVAAASQTEPTPKKPLFKRRPVVDKPVEPIFEAAAAAAAEPVESADSAESATPKAKSKVPNFGKMQRRLIWVVGAVAIIVVYLVLVNITAKAKVTLYAAGTKVAIDTTFSVDPNQSSSSIGSGVLAGQTVTFSKDLTQSVTPTGQQDAGTPANGQMTVSNGTGADQPLVAGTRFQAPDGKIFKSTADITVPKAYLDVGGNIVKGTKSVAVTSEANGDGYNEAAAAYAIPALNNPKVTATGSQMSGGTSKIVTVVSATDITTAQAAMLAADKDGSQKSLDSHVPTGYVAMSGSTNVAATNVASNPAVNAQTTTATVTLHATYTELAVKQSDYQAFVNARELGQVGSSNQIYDDGLSGAQVTQTGKDSSGRAQFSFQTQAYSGAKIDTATLAKSLAGKKYGDATDLAGKQPGVQRVTINLSPSWITSLPHAASKITVTIQVASDN